MKIGVIGCGNISDTYFESQKIFNNLNIIACADLSKDIADQKANKYNIKSQNVDELLNTRFLLKEFNSFKKRKISLIDENLDEILNSTSHFTLVDKYQNVISLTSSIESSFGSRLFTDGFFLNNQLTDFRFRTKDINGNILKNIPMYILIIRYTTFINNIFYIYNII